LQIRKIALLIPSLEAGGAERVMATLANEFARHNDLRIFLILYVKPIVFYELNDNIQILKLNFNFKRYSKIITIIKIMLFLRKRLKNIQPDFLLSFGGKYNSVVLITTLGLGIKTFISDRSRPGISYGFLPDLLNPFIYKLAHGIISQTNYAKEYIYSKTKHKNIKVIPNPIFQFNPSCSERENIILNVGRFISTKRQDELIKMFIEINPKDWRLVLVGEGPNLGRCKEIAVKSLIGDRIHFIENTHDIQRFYKISKIFAFTSISEGFPNALAEAMVAGCACLSYDCLSGPSELIRDGENGFLIKLGDKEQYKSKLSELIENKELVYKFSLEAQKIVNIYNPKIISHQFLQFMINSR